jgi:hypothetical protein
VGPNQQRPQGAAETFLSLDGVNVGLLAAVEQTQTAAGFDVKLSIAPQLMSRDFYDFWLSPALQGQKPHKTVRLTSLNASGQMFAAQEAAGVAPRQIAFPLLDASSHESIKLSVSFSAPGMHPVQHSGTPPSVHASSMQTHLLVSNFRLAFQGNPLLDASRVSKIEALSFGPRGGVPTMAGPTKSQAVGSKSLPQEIKTMTGPGGDATSNLVFYLPQTHAMPFQQWLATTPNQTRNASITYLKPNMSPWGTLDLKGLTITKITTETNRSQEGIHTVRVEMTVGSLQMTLAP